VFYPLSLALSQCLKCAVLLFLLTPQASHKQTSTQSLMGEAPQVKPVFWLTAQSNFSKEPLLEPDILSFRSGIEHTLGGLRCRIVFESEAEIEKDIQNDDGVEALMIEIKHNQKKPMIVLWVKCKGHTGKIAEYPCDAATGDRCLGLALKDFPTDVSNHDKDCHRGKPCRVDANAFVVPSDAP
jgi:hypothetical protein